MRAPICIGLVAAVGLVACNGGGDDPAPTTDAVTTTTTVVTTDDGVLRIGALLPSSGDGVDLGQPTLDGVRLAVAEINAAGGVNGNEVQLVVRDEGDDTSTAARALEQLLATGVDAIVGPASSRIALAVLPDAVAAGVAACSPTASALALDDLPDDGLVFRTIPSDSMQAVAVARALEATGRSPVAIAYLDDAWGRPIAAAVEESLRAGGIELAVTAGYSPTDDSLALAAVEVMEVEPGAVAVIGDGDTTLRMAAAVSASASPSIIVTDAARRPTSLAAVQAMSGSLRNRIVGISPTATATDELLMRLRQVRPGSSGLYATNAYDCVNLLALSAVAAESTLPRAIASQMTAVSTSGSGCADFAACSQLIVADRNIDYDGPSGVTALGPRGDPATGRFDRFVYDESGRDVTVSQFTVTTG